MYEHTNNLNEQCQHCCWGWKTSVCESCVDRKLFNARAEERARVIAEVVGTLESLDYDIDGLGNGVFRVGDAIAAVRALEKGGG